MSILCRCLSAQRGLFFNARQLSASSVLYTRPSKAVGFPRWVNSKQGRENGNDGEEDSESESSNNEDSPPPSSPPNNNNVAKPSIPENYPTVLALPIARRPLFPGFYKAVVIRNPSVVAAVKDMMKRGQPYLGAFLLKDEKEDADIVKSLDSIHRVGVFAQVTSVFQAQGQDGEEGLTAVLYPHRRIHIDELIQPITTPSESTESTEPPTEPENALSIHTSFLASHPISIARITNLPTPPYSKNSQHIRAFVSEIVSIFKDIAQLNPLFRDQITNFSINQVAQNVFDEPDKLADFAAAVSSGEPSELQEVLETTTVEERLQKALVVLKKELINAQLQSKLSRDVDSKIAKRQREYYLMEQLKGIKKELGIESDGKDRLIEKFREREKNLKMPEVVKKVFEEEIQKLGVLESQASEFGVTRNYLEWLTQIPWGIHTPTTFSLPYAQETLDADHYGLSTVKNRILEFLAVSKLLGTTRGKIILLSGPPGVGKTSVGKSIARALGRQFFRFSVGGLTDVAEIKGHRRTYIGALPGKIVQALKRVGCENPLVLIDEIDKVGRGYGGSGGDPTGALLEMLDPEQNEGFLDHYMDLPINLSQILFVCTANTLHTIPAPLLDRMEVIEVSGYTSDEKVAIATRYLGPQAKEGSGLGKADVEIEETAYKALIEGWCRESGVRGLKKLIEKIYRKAALKIVRDLGEDLPEPKPEVTKTIESTEPPSNDPTTEPPKEEEKEATTITHPPIEIPSNVSLRITTDNLKDYIGPQVYQKDRIYGNPDEGDRAFGLRPAPAGVSTGLGYLGNGSGSVLSVEALAMPGKGGSLTLTGKLGEVIRESAQIALSYVKSHAFELGITKNENDGYLDGRDVHVHLPEGSIGKDGPSAGTALLTAFVSLGLNKPISSDIAMTGEITLHGTVLPVGGLKEKILAAHRAGIKTVIAPLANRADIEENEEEGVPENVKKEVRFVYVRDVREVLKEVGLSN